MKALGYTLGMSLLTILFFWLYLHFANVEAEMFFLIGLLSSIILYVIIGYPTLLLTRTKKLGNRIARYLVAIIVGILLFFIFYSGFGELTKDAILTFLLPRCLIAGFLLGILFFLPLEITRSLR